MSNDETCQEKIYWIKYQSQLGLTWLTHHPRYMIGTKKLLFEKKKLEKKIKIKSIKIKL
jgi:hypothetical protein